MPKVLPIVRYAVCNGQNWYLFPRVRATASVAESIFCFISAATLCQQRGEPLGAVCCAVQRENPWAKTEAHHNSTLWECRITQEISRFLHLRKTEKDCILLGLCFWVQPAKCFLWLMQ